MTNQSLVTKSRQWLIGWGAVHRERAITGDPAALPNSFPILDGDACAGGRRSSPSNLSGIQEIFLAVESAIHPREALLRAALGAKYIFGYRQRTGRFTYELPGGEWVALEADDLGEPIGPEPLRYLRRTAVAEEEFDLAAGFDEVRDGLTEVTVKVLDHLALQSGVRPLHVVADVIHRFERSTLPKRAGWR